MNISRAIPETTTLWMSSGFVLGNVYLGRNTRHLYLAYRSNENGLGLRLLDLSDSRDKSSTKGLKGEYRDVTDDVNLIVGDLK